MEVSRVNDVMAGFIPAIHVLSRCQEDVDARDIGERKRRRPSDSYAPGMTTLDMQLFGCILSTMNLAMDEVFKALADASRRSLLDRLHVQNGQTLNDLCDGLAMTRQAVTKHLAILEAANLVTTFRHGREKLHYLNPVPIHQIGERWIKKFERGKLAALSELKRQLEQRDE
jgi:DNA-binding transcriptional ArsR family regulator